LQFGQFILPFYNIYHSIFSNVRFFDSSGDLVLLPEEAAQVKVQQATQQAEQERQKAERLAAQLRALGVEPEV